MFTMMTRPSVFLFGFIILTLRSTASTGIKKHEHKLSNFPKYEHKLLKNLFTEHEPLAWPFPGRNVADIHVQYIFKALVDFDAKRQILRTTGLFFVTWQDDSLRWNPEDYNNTEVVYVAPSMVWKPDLVIVNSVNKLGVIGTDGIKIFVSYKGHIMWAPGDFIETYCKVDITYYPMDVQKCKLTLKVWGCPLKGAKLILPKDPVSIESTEDNGEWEILKITGEETNIGRISGASFVLHLKRRKMFYVVNMILPIVFLSLLNFLVFGLPVESGEKITLSISIFLSYAVFLTLVNDKLPENSDGLCYFSAYLAAEICVSVASTILTVFLLNIYHRPAGTMVSPRYVRMLKPLEYTNVNREISVKVWSTDKGELSEKDCNGDEKTSVPMYILWKDVAKGVDRICLRAFWWINIIITVIVMLAISGII